MGADLYYLYGTTTLDFVRAKLILGGAVAKGKESFPIVSQVTNGGVRITATVNIHGVQGGFTVDTGASVTELDGALARKAGLKNAGAATKIGAVSCTTTLQPVSFQGATIGSVKLPSVVAGSSTNAITAKTAGAIQGLIGADILSTYGSVSFDFLQRKVVLG